MLRGTITKRFQLTIKPAWNDGDPFCAIQIKLVAAEASIGRSHSASVTDRAT